MNIGEVRIAYPFVEYSVKVTHHTERKSTAMEWMLLEIAQKVEFYSEYATIPLEEILTSIFMVVDGNILLRQVLTELVDVGALEQITTFSDQSEWSDLRCGDLRLTADGRRLQREGKLPAKAQNNNLTIIYDVVKNRLEKSSKGMSDKTINLKLRDINENNMPGFPGSLIKQRIEKWQEEGKESPAWLQRSSRIDDIEPEGAPKVKWKNTSHKIIMDSDGKLSLLGAPDEGISASILQEIDLGTLPDYELPHIDMAVLQSQRKYDKYAKIEDNIASYAAKADIVAVAARFANIVEGKNNKACIMLGQSSFTFEDTGKKLIIGIPDAFPAGLCYQDDNHRVYAAALEGHIGNIHRFIPYMYENAGDLSAFILNLVRKYYMQERRMMRLLDYAKDISYEEFYTADYIKELLNSAEIQQLTPVDKILNRLQRLDGKIQEVLGDVPSPASSETIRSALLGKKVEILGDVREWSLQWREALESLKNRTGVDVNAIDWQDSGFGLSLERMEQVAMVTDDKNFQNFAKSEGVETTTAHNLHEELTASNSSKGKGKNRKNRR